MNNRFEDKTNEYFYNLFKTPKAKKIAEEINEYLYKHSEYKHEVEDYHIRQKNGERTDCIGYISKKGLYKFATITKARKAVFVLHLGKKFNTDRAKTMQMEIDTLLQNKYVKTDKTKLTSGEAYIRLEWVQSLNQILPFIDEAYELRLIR
jgi:hypothetical protein